MILLFATLMNAVRIFLLSSSVFPCARVTTAHCTRVRDGLDYLLRMLQRGSPVCCKSPPKCALCVAAIRRVCRLSSFRTCVS
uniref:Putative secreted protein ovary overexpressed n=1 Tax=Rhipicephalus microplus TaxID=6941 RepID=A0A6M2DAS8_RHIMP